MQTAHPIGPPAGRVSGTAMPVAGPEPAPFLRPQAPASIDPLAEVPETDWNAYVRYHPDGTLFHTPAWSRSVGRTYQHANVGLAAWRGQRIVGVLPLMELNSWVRRGHVVSVPCGVDGGLLADDPATGEALLAHAFEQARRLGQSSIELRSRRPMVAELPFNDRYVGFERELPARGADVLSWLPRKARAAARNGRDRFALTLRWGDEWLATAWRLYCLNMRRLGSLNYPLRFVRSLLEATPGAHWIGIVFREDRPVASLITFLFGQRVMPYLYGATAEARRCSAANFIYYHTMARAADEGFRVFDFGRSRRDNPGSFDFKRFHGFEPTPLGYQTWTARGGTSRCMSPTSRGFALARAIWPKLPLCVTRPLGAYLTRHIPG